MVFDKIEFRCLLIFDSRYVLLLLGGVKDIHI